MFNRLRFVDAFLVFGLVLLVYLATMPGAITLEDAGLFQMVCHLDGIGHPPGYPLFTMLCKPLMYFPDVINGNLVSSLFAGLTVVALYFVCLKFFNDRAIAAVAALAYGFSATFWSQAIIIEVYTLATLMFALCWWLLQSLTERRQAGLWFLFCFCFGLALSNHWPLMILSTPALVAVLWPVRAWLWNELRSIRFWAISTVCFLAGLTPYISLLLNTNPEIAVFGPVDSLKDLLKYVSRTAYTDAHATAGLYDKVQYGGWLLSTTFTQFGLAGIPFVAAGIGYSVRRLPPAANVALWLLYLGTVSLLVILLNFEYREYFKAVFRPYPIIACMPLAIWFALGIRLVINSVSGYARWSGFVILPASIILVLVSNFNENNRYESTLAAEYGEAVLNTLPRNSVLFTRGDNQTGVLGYLHHVRGMRPDIELRDQDNLVFSNRLTSPFAREERQRREILRFINESERDIFLLDPWLSPVINYGVYYEIAPRGGFRFVPELDRYLDDLLELYLGDYITDGHEQHFAFHMLIRYARQYLGYVHRVGYEALDETRRVRVALLQDTFAGRLVTLEIALDGPVADDEKRALLALVRKAEKEIPAFVTPRSRAVFYNLVGRLHLVSRPDHSEAGRYYRLSVETWPVSDNPGICALVDIYTELEDESRISHLLARFPEKSC